ncbi:MAG: 16S rRNA (cytidine(1402)-2'-O)-methyltransferase [Oscillospiraceae bacterium]|jgi:16S rRNA (cytidine1402-2'-O)-methyltransferase|nr:16S rRNA (cytidine(1402)-2'-O)-methyltransferase [Oscillospiraceae bacterium]
MDNKAGKLYIVGTPLGNLGDFSPRGAQALRDADFIAAEDTRVSIKLLNHFGIKKPMVSYHEHNVHARGELIVERVLNGESCAVITDAGMPCISDPGEDLVRACAAHGIETVVVPGPSALIAALAASGLAAGRFAFEGFLSVKKGSRFAHLESVKNDPRTLVFYEAPHKLRATLADMLGVFGDRPVALARELTKIHEEIIRTTLTGAISLYKDKDPRGEYVLVVSGASEAAPRDSFTFDEAVDIARSLADDGMPLSSAAKESARMTGYKKGDIYREVSKDRG